MGQGEALALELDVSQQQQVDVERARAVAGRRERPAVLGLDPLADIEQGVGLERGANADGGVEEVGLVEDLADRLGLVGGGDGLDLDSMRPQVLDGPAQVPLTLADVRSQPQVADALLGGRVAQAGPSSSSRPISRSAALSRVTSTAASLTG
jgi:hypothetical protein